MPGARIKKVSYMENYQLDIMLGNGHRIIYNMEPKLITARFRDLSDRKLFYAGQITDNGKVIRWNENTELSINEIMLHVEA